MRAGASFNLICPFFISLTLLTTSSLLPLLLSYALSLASSVVHIVLLRSGAALADGGLRMGMGRQVHAALRHGGLPLQPHGGPGRDYGPRDAPSGRTCKNEKVRTDGRTDGQTDERAVLFFSLFFFLFLLLTLFFFSSSVQLFRGRGPCEPPFRSRRWASAAHCFPG